MTAHERKISLFQIMLIVKRGEGSNDYCTVFSRYKLFAIPPNLLELFSLFLSFLSLETKQEIMKV